MIEFSKNGKAFTEEKLYEKDFSLYTNKKLRQQHINQLNRIAYLVCIKETSRRKFSGKKNTRQELKEAPELPFGVAIVKTLRLLADGNLRMSDVFEHDSPYGVFSGEEILNERNLAKTKEKFQKIFKLYNKIYTNQCEEFEGRIGFIREVEKEFHSTYPKGRVIPSRERHHQDLLEAFGGQSESSGSEYESSSEDEISSMFSKIIILKKINIAIKEKII